MQIIRFFAVAFICLPTMTLFGQETVTGSAQPTAETPATQAPTDERSTMQKANFFLGYNFVKNLQQNGLDLDTQALMQGVLAAAKNEPMGMEPEEINSVMEAVQEMARKKQMAQQAALTEANNAEGKAFIAKFMAEPGVKELEDGIYYKSMKAGDGAKPAPTDQVKINYKGTFPDGSVFDESKGEPLVLGVNQFVGGFSRALQGMKVGDQWQVVLRGDKAYGMQPPPGLPPNKTLMFQIDLLEIIE